MPISTTPMLERIARILASMQPGEEGNSALSVDLQWRDHVPSALAILRAIREPDEEMARAGSVALWEDMVAVAIREAELNPTSFP